WNRWPRRNEYRVKPVLDFRREIDGITAPYGFGPLLSFECVEWHSADRVTRQSGLNQYRPDHPEDLGTNHCITLRGTQHHDWSDICTGIRYKTLSTLLKMWASMLWHSPDLSSSNVMVLGT
ncbi:hypothetical protein PIB30_101045, partial [Stylosanthes scabra]|nr:hypothetical protein [Stylosanthes scabra]